MQVFNDTSGRHCTDEELENKYMSAIWEKLGSMVCVCLREREREREARARMRIFVNEFIAAAVAMA